MCSGGRYENLADYYTERKLPGVGVSIGLSRFFYQLNKAGLLSNEKNTIAKVLVVSMDEDISKAIEVATILRTNNINTQIYTENKKIKAKFKYADKLKIPYVIILGEDEIKTNTVILKNMETGEQQTIKIEQAINIINQ